MSFRVEVRSKIFGRWLMVRKFDAREQALQESSKLARCYPAGAVRVTPAERDAGQRVERLAIEGEA